MLMVTLQSQESSKFRSHFYCEQTWEFDHLQIGGKGFLSKFNWSLEWRDERCNQEVKSEWKFIAGIISGDTNRTITVKNNLKRFLHYTTIHSGIEIWKWPKKPCPHFINVCLNASISVQARIERHCISLSRALYPILTRGLS